MRTVLFVAAGNLPGVHDAHAIGATCRPQAQGRQADRLLQALRGRALHTDGLRANSDKVDTVSILL